MTSNVQWKLLPTKANREMEQAGADAAREYLERTGSNSLFAIYEAMTAAAPAAPAGANLSEQVPLLSSTYNDIAEVNGINGWCVCCREHVEDDGVITHDPSCTFCAIERALSANTPPSAPVECDERAAFERFCVDSFNRSLNPRVPMRMEWMLAARRGEKYSARGWNEMWEGWKGRAALEHRA